MTARTHNAFAVASLITVAAFFPPENINVLTLILCLVGTTVGALIPDMDTSGNYLWGLLPQGQRLGGVLRRIFYKHRTITHSVIGFFLIHKFLSWVLPMIFNSGFVQTDILLASILIGYASHLLSDSLTEEGIPLLFPIDVSFGIPPIKSWRIKTGKWFENLVIFPAVWVYVVWFVNLNKETYLNIFRSLV